VIMEKSTRRQTHRLQREDTDTPEQGAVTASIKMYIAFQAPAASSLVRPPALHGQLPSNLLSVLFPKGEEHQTTTRSASCTRDAFRPQWRTSALQTPCRISALPGKGIPSREEFSEISPSDVSEKH